jgi:hypothetical protein
MRAIGIVLLALLLCIGFVVFFTVFLVVPFLLLGVYCVAVTVRDRRRTAAPSPKPRRRLRRRSVSEGEAS